MSLTQAQLLFSDLLGQAGISGEGLNEDGMAQIRLREKWMPRINVCYLQADDSLLIFGEAGAADEERLPALMLELMQRQHLFAGSGGATYAVAPDNQSLTVQVKLPVAASGVGELTAALENVVRELRTLRLELFSNLKDKSGDGETARLEPQDFSAIRV